MSSEEGQTIEFVPLLNFEDNYEILNQYPFTIRKKSNKRVIKESVNSQGYIQVWLNGKHYLLHRLIALQFLTNPDPINNDVIDHINRNRADNHLSNLRWTTQSENQCNRTSYKGINHEIIDELPNDAFEIEYYDTRNGRREIKNYYYSISTDSFYYDNEVNYRIIPSHLTNTGYPIICIRDINNKAIALVISRFKQQQGIM